VIRDGFAALIEGDTLDRAGNSHRGQYPQGLAAGQGKAAQHKTVGLLHEKLKPKGVYVGEVVVLGLVKGTAFDQGNATIEPAAVAERFWELSQKRAETTVAIG